MHKTFDFNDLFNNININGIHKVINILFKENEIHLNLNGTFNEHYLKVLTRFILHHNYILLNIIYQQSIVSSQGEKASSMLLIFVCTILSILQHVTISFYIGTVMKLYSTFL